MTWARDLNSIYIYIYVYIYICVCVCVCMCVNMLHTHVYNLFLFMMVIFRCRIRLFCLDLTLTYIADSVGCVYSCISRWVILRRLPPYLCWMNKRLIYGSPDVIGAHLLCFCVLISEEKVMRVGQRREHVMTSRIYHSHNKGNH